jgi:hypothetical protein
VFKVIFTALKLSFISSSGGFFIFLIDNKNQKNKIQFFLLEIENKF